MITEKDREEAEEICSGIDNTIGYIPEYAKCSGIVNYAPLKNFAYTKDLNTLQIPTCIIQKLLDVT